MAAMMMFYVVQSATLIKRCVVFKPL